MRVVVVGGTGNVGTAVVSALAAHSDGHRVRVVARRRPDGELAGRVDWVAADIVSDELTPLFEGADAVVHLAWLIQPSRDETTLHRVNVEGTARVLDAVAAAGVPRLVYASSVGAYSAGPKDRGVTEDWPTHGVATSMYSRQKAYVERLLDRFETDRPAVAVVRLRPALVFSARAASEIRRYFMGPFLPRPALAAVPLFPKVDGLVFQAVHSDDLGEAFAMAVTGDVTGAFNIAGGGIIDSTVAADILGARPIPAPPWALRAAAAAAWHLRLSPTSPGWIDLALRSPLMDTSRARTDLGWEPRRTGRDALRDLVSGLRAGQGGTTPPLTPSAGGIARWREVATGLGARP